MEANSKRCGLAQSEQLPVLEHPELGSADLFKKYPWLKKNFLPKSKHSIKLAARRVFQSQRLVCSS
jgi:hypothetical protein